MTDQNTNDIDDEKLERQITDQFADLQDEGSAGHEQMVHKQSEYTDRSPELSGGDVDAAWEDSDVGEESVGGENPTPDQSVVEELGEALGITYEDDEPLGTEDKLLERDRDRWELDPASAEDFNG
ncbi:MAG: DUF6335 family protein [Acidobacteriota bacterium]